MKIAPIVLVIMCCASTVNAEAVKLYYDTEELMLEGMWHRSKIQFKVYSFGQFIKINNLCL